MARTARRRTTWIAHLGLPLALAVTALLLARAPEARPARWAPRGLGIALLGNGRLLAAEDAEGTVVELFWPHPGLRPRLASRHAWFRRPEGPPPGAGLFAGLEVRGRRRWLRDAPEVVPIAVPGSVVVGTQFRFADGIVVRQRSLVPPQQEALVRDYLVRGPPELLQGAMLVWHMPLSLGAGPSGDQARYDAARGVIVQVADTSLSEAAALASSTAPVSVSLAQERQEETVSEDRRSPTFRPVVKSGGEIETVIRWPLVASGVPGEGAVLQVCLALGEADAVAQEALATARSPFETHQAEADAWWEAWLKGCELERGPRRRESATPDSGFGRGMWSRRLPSARDAEQSNHRRAGTETPPYDDSIARLASTPALDLALPLDPLSRRSLIVLKMLSDRETGAIVAGAREYWAYCWPRDAVFCAAALDVAGKHAEAERLYRFLARVQRPDGGWEARYWADGQPVRDGRLPQLDAPGLVAWGLWLHSALAPGGAGFARGAYPVARRAAEVILATLDPAMGLPGPGLDANEAGPAAFTASNAAACYAGLRAAARLAEASGRAAEAGRYRAGAERIRAGMERFLWSAERGRFLRAVRPESAGLDPFMFWLAWPSGMFAPDEARVTATAGALRASRRLPSGWYRGLVRSVGSEPWLHQNGLIAAYLFAAGRREEADALASLLGRAATPFGTLPERVDARTLRPTSTTPLAWAHAMQLLLTWQRAGGRLPLP
jgi:hypothetical protein